VVMIGGRGNLETAGVATAATRSHFAGQHSNQRKFGPLAGPEWLQKLLAGVLKSRSNRIHGGNRQVAPRGIAVAARYCEA
jgi:hypothetical protein